MNGQDYRKDDKVVLFYYSATVTSPCSRRTARHNPVAQPARRVRRPRPALRLAPHLARREIRVIYAS